MLVAVAPLVAALPWLIPAVAGAVGLGLSSRQSKKNRDLQSGQNTEDRNFQRQMYDLQRGDALADRAHYEEYNDPKNTIARMKNAGLAPQLLYGNSGPVGTTEMPRSATATGGSLPAPQVDYSGMKSSLDSFSTILGQSAQLDNLRAQNDLYRQQSLNIAADTILKGTENTGKTIDNTQKERLKSNQPIHMETQH
jgi:hypothetical protein